MFCIIMTAFLSVCFSFISSGFGWEGGGGETAQRQHQETERCGGAAGEGAEQAADRL